MRLLISIRFIVVLLAAIVSTMILAPSAALADEGFVNLTVYKGGWVIGGSRGGGPLNLRGRT